MKILKLKYSQCISPAYTESSVLVKRGKMNIKMIIVIIGKQNKRQRDRFCRLQMERAVAVGNCNTAN